jgi:hypothetical protein
MDLKLRFANFALSLALLGALQPSSTRANDELGRGNRIKHVLLISVDGLHALDVSNYVAAHPGSAFAELSRHGITYSNARTPANSDSFPGLLALITGGSPNSHGLFYDVSYDREIFDPTNTTCSSQPGNMMVFDESTDKYIGNPPVSLNVLDPTTLPNHLVNGQCVRLFPHNAMRANTIFEIVRAALELTGQHDAGRRHANRRLRAQRDFRTLGFELLAVVFVVLIVFLRGDDRSG